MGTKSTAIHVAKIERKHTGKTYVSYLLRQSYRAGGAVKHRTLGNLSHLPARLIDLVRRSLHGETFVAAHEAFRTTATSRPSCSPSASCSWTRCSPPSRRGSAPWPWP